MTRETLCKANQHSKTHKLEITKVNPTSLISEMDKMK